MMIQTTSPWTKSLKNSVWLSKNLIHIQIYIELDNINNETIEMQKERLKYAIPMKILDAAEKMSKKVMQLK